jgi:hypothetical protein
MMAPDLLGDVGEQVLHESRQLRGLFDTNQHVEMIAHDRDGKEADAIEFLRTPKNTEKKLIRGRTWSKKKSTSDRARCHLYH